MPITVYTHETWTLWARPRHVHLHEGDQGTWDNSIVMAGGLITQDITSQTAIYAVTSDLLLGSGEKMMRIRDHRSCKAIGQVGKHNEELNYCTIKLDAHTAPDEPSMREAKNRKMPLHYPHFQELTMDSSFFTPATPLRARTSDNRLIKGRFASHYNHEVNVTGIPDAEGDITHKCVSIVTFSEDLGKNCEGMWVYTFGEGLVWDDSGLRLRFEYPDAGPDAGRPFPSSLFTFEYKDHRHGPANRVRVAGMIVGGLEGRPGYLVMRPMTHVLQHLDYRDDKRYGYWKWRDLDGRETLNREMVRAYERG